MKIIQTLWTKPGLNAGWLDRRYHFMSWAFSCLQLRKFYEEVEIYTDALGKKILIDELGLPYTRVHTILDDFNYPSYLWAAPKLLAYGLQDKPFLHIDGDVFLFSPINEEDVDFDFVFQNKEEETVENGFYTRILKDFFELEEGRADLPEWLAQLPFGRVEAVNAGVFGGKSIAFFKELSKQAFHFLDSYSGTISRMFNPSFANHLSEQVLAEYLRKKMQVTSRTLFHTNRYLDPRLIRDIGKTDEIGEAFGNEDQFAFSKEVLPFSYMVLDHFGISPIGRQYVHLIGASKKSLCLCKLLSRRLLADYPEYYHRILRYFDKGASPLQKVPGKALVFSGAGEPAEDLATRVRTENAAAKCSLRERTFKLKADRLFERTISLFKILTSTSLEGDMDYPSFKEHFEARLTGVSNEHYQERLRDLFRFEQERFHFAQSDISDADLETIEKKSSESIDVFVDPCQPDLNDQIISINPFMCFITSKWYWSDDDSYVAAHLRAGEVHTLVYVDAITKRLVDVDLTPLNRAIIFSFSEPRDFHSGFQELQNWVQVRDEKKLYEQFFQCLVYLINNGVLLVNHKTDLNEE